MTFRSPRKNMFYNTLPRNMNKNRLELCREQKFCIEKKQNNMKYFVFLLIQYFLGLIAA